MFSFLSCKISVSALERVLILYAAFFHLAMCHEQLSTQISIEPYHNFELILMYITCLANFI